MHVADCGALKVVDKVQVKAHTTKQARLLHPAVLLLTSSSAVMCLARRGTTNRAAPGLTQSGRGPLTTCLFNGGRRPPNVAATYSVQSARSV